MFNKEEEVIVKQLKSARDYIKLAYQTAQRLSYQVLPCGKDKDIISIIDSMIVDGVITNCQSARAPEITKMECNHE